MNVPLSRFARSVIEGNYLHALGRLLKQDLQDALEHHDSVAKKALFCFADALAYRSPYHAFVALRHLLSNCDDPALLTRLQSLEAFVALAASDPQDLEKLKGFTAVQDDDLDLFAYLAQEKQGIPPSLPAFDQSKQSSVLRYYSAHCLRLMQESPEWARAVQLHRRPLLPLPMHKAVVTPPSKQLLVFANLAELCQQLIHPNFVEALLMGHYFPFILGIHAQMQLTSWHTGIDSQPPILCTQNPWIHALQEEVTELFDQLKHQKLQTPAAQRLYELGIGANYLWESQRLGRSCQGALWASYALHDWRDPHKHHGRAVLPALLASQKDPWLAQLNAVAQPKRPAVQRSRYRVAHVVKSLIDIAHAPTQLLMGLAGHRDSGLFDWEIYTTESQCLHPSEYPYASFLAEDSEDWGKETLRRLRALGIDVHIGKDRSQSFEEKAASIAAQMQNSHIDCVVYHLPDPVGALSHSFSSVPRHVFFDHAGNTAAHPEQSFVPPSFLELPRWSKLDLLLTCEEKEAPFIQGYNARGTAVCNLPYCLDVSTRPSQSSPTQLPPRSDAALRLVTVSVHLADRLSPAFCEAVIQILSHCPQAHYFAIGPLDHKSRAAQALLQSSVHARIHLLGVQEDPIRYLSEMDIYLNEFPFGGGLALIEALSQGLPIVSEYLNEGSPQERFGALYYGEEHCIPAGQHALYVQRAVELIENESKRQALSEHAKQCYAKHANVKGYAQHFEASLLKTLAQ